MIRIELLPMDSGYLAEIVALWNDNTKETACYTLTNEERAVIEQQSGLYCRSAYGTVHIAC